MNVRRQEFELPLESPLHTAVESLKVRQGYLLEIDIADNTAVTGIGEATPLPGWTEDYESSRQALDAIQNADTLEKALGTLEGTPAARHGFSTAALDREAKLEGEPLYRSLGEDGKSVERVPVNATISDGSIADTREEARDAIDAGYDTIKVKVGARPVEDDAARLQAIQTAVGSDVQLRVDANASWSRSEARQAIELFPELEYLEQPLDPADLRGHADLRDIATIALDETLRERSVASIFEVDAADVFVLKPMVLGGLDRAYQKAQTARANGVDPVISTTVDSVVARTGAVHLAAALNPTRSCGLATADLLETDLAPDPTTVSSGYITVPESPGTGVNIEWPIQ